MRWALTVWAENDPTPIPRRHIAVPFLTLLRLSPVSCLLFLGPAPIYLMRFPCKQRVLWEPMPFLGVQMADYFNPWAPSVPPENCLVQCGRDLVFILLYFFLIFFPPSTSVTIPLKKMTRPLMATISSHQPLRKGWRLMGTSSL